MPLDNAEKINDALAGLGIGAEILSFVQALPPGPRKAVDFGGLLDIIKNKVLPLIDQVAEDVAD